MKKDDWVLLPFPAANRDPKKFEDPDTFVVDREENRHAAFGLGIHRCLGSNLARLELKVAIEEFIKRFPSFELAGETTWSIGQIRGPRGGLIDVVDHDDAASPATPAASVLLARDGGGGGLEILMIRRGLTGSFGGMWAFPGGVVEIEDVPPGTAPDPIPAARMAAVREAHEEVGLHIDPASMVLWSHWLPAGQVPTRRFSTWFFLAPAADDHHDGDVEIDGHEVHDHRWIAPSQALDLRARGEIQLAPPTFVTLRPVALITMATGYVGPALARSLAHAATTSCSRAAGDDTMVGVEESFAEQIPARIARRQRQTVTDVDLSTAEGNQALVAQALDRFGRLDSACLVTGLIVVGKFLDMTIDQWERVKRMNLDMVFHGLQAVLPPMVAAKHGQVVVFTSATGARPTRSRRSTAAPAPAPTASCARSASNTPATASRSTPSAPTTWTSPAS
jgi:8-oxo-dGTP pyrophosphatase MutT (NUDIX family)/NADP-dependent 3-hydroxy acid dehydrogenase YdfG